MFGILDSGFGFIYAGDCSEFRSSQLHCSSIIMYIEIVRDKQNEYIDTLSTSVDPTIHLTSSLSFRYSILWDICEVLIGVVKGLSAG